MRLVVVESPYAGDTIKNIEYLCAAMSDCFARGEAPYASHGLYTREGVLDDTIPEERALGIEAGLLWARNGAASVFYTDLGWSRGMKAAEERAKLEGRPCEYRTLGGKWATETG